MRRIYILSWGILALGLILASSADAAVCRPACVSLRSGQADFQHPGCPNPDGEPVHSNVSPAECARRMTFPFEVPCTAKEGSSGAASIPVPARRNSRRSMVPPAPMLSFQWRQGGNVLWPKSSSVTCRLVTADERMSTPSPAAPCLRRLRGWGRRIFH